MCEELVLKKYLFSFTNGLKFILNILLFFFFFHFLIQMEDTRNETTVGSILNKLFMLVHDPPMWGGISEILKAALRKEGVCVLPGVKIVNFVIQMEDIRRDSTVGSDLSFRFSFLSEKSQRPSLGRHSVLESGWKYQQASSVSHWLFVSNFETIAFVIQMADFRSAITVGDMISFVVWLC